MTVKFRALSVTALALATLWTVGCGHYTCGATFGSSTCNASGNGISGGNGNNNQIGVTTFLYFGGTQMAAEGLNFDKSEDFAPISSFTSPTFVGETGSAGQANMVVVNKKWIYMPFGDGQVFGFVIDATTADLSPLAGSPFTAAAGGSTTVADPAGKFLFVGGQTQISVLAINATDGSLSEVAGSPFTAQGGAPVQLATDGTGKFLFAVDGAQISAWAYNSAGTLNVVTGSPFSGVGFNSMQIAGEPTGKFLFGITQEDGSNGGAVDPNIYLFTIGSTGSVAGLAPFPTGDSPAFMAVSPNGKFVYTFNQVFTPTTNGFNVTTNPLRGFGFNGAGTLTQMGTSPFTSLTGSQGIFDQSGQYIFAIAGIPNTTVGGMFAWAVDANGGVSSSLHHAGVASSNYVVTDEP